MVPYFQKLQKEGELGRKKIMQLSRYGTVIIASMQSIGVAVYLASIKLNPKALVACTYIGAI